MPPVLKVNDPGVSEPSWHRRARRVRSKARLAIRRFISKPKVKQSVQVLERARQLERHHSRPRYKILRRVIGMSEWDSWDGHGKSWSYWGAKQKGRGPRNAEPKKGSGKKGKTKPTKEEKDTAKDKKQEMFPGYDVMPLSSSSSAQPVENTDDPAIWQRAFFDLVQSNPQLKLPDGFKDQLMAAGKPMEESEKDRLYQQQKILNTKRKAQQKLERLQQALQRKKFQMTAYQEQMKKQLHFEMQRFQRETAELEQSIKETKELCRKLEAGETVETVIQPYMDADEDLATLLGLTSSSTGDAAKIAQLQQEKNEIAFTAMQLKTQVDLMMSHAAAPWLNSPSGAQMGVAGMNQGSPLGTSLTGLKGTKRQKTAPESEVQEIVDSPSNGGGLAEAMD